MKRILAAATLIAALTFPAFAQTGPSISAAPGTSINLAPGSTIGTPPALTPSQEVANHPVIEPQPPAMVVSTGTLAGDVLTWLIAAFGTPIAGFLVLYLKRLATLAGVKVSQAMSDKLNEIILNGLNAGAAGADERLKGEADVEIKSAIMQHAVEYAQTHGADTIKALGLDPQSGSAVEAIRARAATLVADPATPTPAALDPPKAINPAGQAKAA
jgi:hypothetical protein